MTRLTLGGGDRLPAEETRFASEGAWTEAGLLALAEKLPSLRELQMCHIFDFSTVFSEELFMGNELLLVSKVFFDQKDVKILEVLVLAASEVDEEVLLGLTNIRRLTIRKAPVATTAVNILLKAFLAGQQKFK